VSGITVGILKEQHSDHIVLTDASRVSSNRVVGYTFCPLMAVIPMVVRVVRTFPSEPRRRHRR
jgi:hypothetical protein